MASQGAARAQCELEAHATSCAAPPEYSPVEFTLELETLVSASHKLRQKVIDQVSFVLWMLNLFSSNVRQDYYPYLRIMHKTEAAQAAASSGRRRCDYADNPTGSSDVSQVHNISGASI